MKATKKDNRSWVYAGWRITAKAKNTGTLPYLEYQITFSNGFVNRRLAWLFHDPESGRDVAIHHIHQMMAVMDPDL